MRLTLRKRDPSSRVRHLVPGAELDRELAERTFKGDREALSRLVDRHIGPVYKYVWRYLGPGHDELVDRVVRATFRDALSRLRPYARGRARVPMRLWLIRRASRHLARQRGKWKVEGTDMQESRDLVALRKAMQKLPPRQSAAIALALFEEVAPDEMAQALGPSTAGAMRLVRRALRRIGSMQVEE